MATDVTYGSNIDLAGNELRNARAHVLTAAPAGTAGKFYYNSTDNKLYWHNGTTWISAGGAELADLSGQASAFGQSASNGSATTAARSDHYHALPVLPKLNSLQLTPDGNVGMNGYTLTGLGAGSASGDSLAWQQVLASSTTLISGLFSSTNPVMNGTAGVGTSAQPARSDHVHPSDTSRAAVGQTMYIGTTGVTINRASAPLSLTGVNIDGSAGSATNATNATNIGVTNDATTNATMYPVWVAANNGNQAAKVTSSKLTYNPSTGAMNIGGKITGLADGSAATDAATVGQVQAAAQGLDVKASVRAAVASGSAGTYNNSGGTAGNGQFTSAPQVIDGVTLVNGDRVLVLGSGSLTGIYTVITAGSGSNGTWNRAADFDSSADVTPNSFVFVEEGSTYADSGWVMTADGAITVGGAIGTPMSWVQFTGAGQITAGNGLTKTGNTLDVGAGTGISVAADTVAIDTAVVARKYSTTLSTSATSYTVTHNLGTRDVQVSVVQTGSPYGVVYTAWEATSTNTITVYFATAPAANSLRVNVVG